MLGVLATMLMLVVGATEDAEPASARLEAYTVLRDSLHAMTVDTATVREVNGIFLEHGLINVMLESGTMAELTAVNGRRLGYVFRGEGTAVFQPDLAIEKVNLERFYEQPLFMEQFTQAVFLCTDTFIAEQFNAQPLAVRDSAKDLAKDLAADLAKDDDPVDQLSKITEKYWKYVTLSYDTLQLDDGLAYALLNNTTEGPFIARVRRPGEMLASLIYQPREDEPYRLIAHKPGTKLDDPVDVNQCPGPAGRMLADEEGVTPIDAVKVSSHTLTMDFNLDLRLTATDRLSATVLADSLRWFNLGLFPLLEIDSITMDGVGAIPFFRSKDGFMAWLQLPRTYRSSEVLTMTVHYHGEIMKRVGDLTVLYSSILWYPSHSYKQKSTFDVSFSYPSTMTLVSIGDCISSSTAGDRRLSQWRTSLPVRNASFHLGYFRQHEVDAADAMPKATILYNTAGHVDDVALDLKQSLEFFTKLFGPLPVDSLTAAELPGYHGEAFPGLLHLSHMAFDYTSWSSSDFFEEQFVAHEVAHQWWGIAVDFASYRDQWLSEGFSEYSALMYTQLASSEAGRFFTLLDRYREDIIDFGKRGIGDNLAQPSIGLGRRVSEGASRLDAGAYNTFVYYKGAWVLHMLRNLMLDLSTMREDAFMTTMKRFYETYRRKSVTTDQFRELVEQVVGRDMRWFFDQWVDGNTIPTYTWAWKSEKDATGAYKNVLRIRQSGVPETFRMYIPIKVEYDNDTFVRYRVQMVGGEAVMELPPSTAEIDNITFNEFLSVLCTSKEEGF